MNRYDQHNYRGNSGRDYENRNDRRNQGDERNLSNYLSRYQERGNYYGMPDNEYEYRNVRASRGADFGNNTPGPVGGYGEHSYYNGNDRDRYSSSNPYSRSNRDQNRQSDDYGSGSSQRNRSGQNNQYRYGDPNPYMDYNRNEGYERTRGTGWRSESDDSRRGASDYSRQDNSYQASGSGRRYSAYGRDERYNYGHDQMTDIHLDRGEHTERRSDNNYGNQRRRSDRDDNYATGMYSSNRAYLADHGQDRDEDMFDYTDENYPNRSPRGYGRSSGPDWSARSAIGSGRDSGSLRG